MRIIKRTDSGNLVIFAGRNLVLEGQIVSGLGWSFPAPGHWTMVLEEATLPDGYVASGWAYTDGVWTINEVGSAEILPGKKRNKIEALTAFAAASNHADITQDEKVWSADTVSRGLLAEVLSVGSVPVGMYWRDAAGASHGRTYSQLQDIGYAILERGLAIDTSLTAKIATVNEATTTAAIEAVTWSY